MGKRELVALLSLSSWCLVMVERLFLAVPQGCLQFVIVVFPDHTHLLFLEITVLGKQPWGLPEDLILNLQLLVTNLGDYLRICSETYSLG